MAISRFEPAGRWRLHVRALGPVDAPTVVMVHGVGVGSRYLTPTAAGLARTRLVLVPDMPGFGLSEKPRTVLGVSELGDALAKWLEAAVRAPVALVANSFGCQVAADLASRRPALVSHAVLLGPTIDPAARSGVRQLLRWCRNAPWERGPLARVIVRDYRDAGLRRVIATFRLALRDRIEDKLPRMPMPTLVARGARDAIAPARWAEQAAALLPAGELATIPGSGHTVNWTNPGLVAAEVERFLSAGRVAASGRR